MVIRAPSLTDATTHKTCIRFPRDLWDTLCDRAAANNRGTGWEIVTILQKVLKEALEGKDGSIETEGPIPR